MHAVLNKTREVDFLAPLLLIMYLLPVFWMAGTKKIEGFEEIVEWFGNSE
ncbi:MAG: putative oxidoreductase [Colwellia sp.]|jgi:putative oxidoreductase